MSGKTILEQIGGTPVVSVDPLMETDSSEVRVYGKLERNNPSGSVKDRIALSMIEDAERSGRLRPGGTIVEATSGNTGIGLAMVAAVKGYTTVIVMPESMSLERRSMLRLFGAEIVLTPAADGMNGAIRHARQLALEHEDWYCPDQFENRANTQAHFDMTAIEILRQVPGIDVFVCGIGTGGTITGCAQRFAAEGRKVEVVGVEPKSGSAIQGLRCLDDYVPPIIDFSVIDQKRRIEDEDAFAMMRVANHHGFAVGISSGAALCIARDIAREMRRGTIVVVLPDGIERYLSIPEVHE